MIDLKLYKNEKQKQKQKQSALDFVDAFVETRKMFNDIKVIADCASDRYTVSQKKEAHELTKGGFYSFVSIIAKMQR